MNEDRDLTKGKPLSLVLSFAFSLIVGNVFQQLYIIVDSIIIGQKVGAKELRIKEWIYRGKRADDNWPSNGASECDHCNRGAYRHQ